MLWCDCRDFLYFQVLMGMLLATNYEKKPFLPKVEVAVKNLFNEPADAFYTGKVMDLLFDGVSIDCSSKEDTTVAVCLQLEDAPAVRRIDENHLAFSILGGVSFSIYFVFESRVWLLAYIFDGIFHRYL